MADSLAIEATTAVPGGARSAECGSVRPLDPVERRVLGVLIEKGKTTPEQYPLSLNALVTGCNQKSNRDPVMALDEERVSRAISRLREAGAMAEVFGSGRIGRYRHLAYEWLGVEKEQLSILAELLLRGEQSEGDLRGRASRMDPIADLPSLREHLDALASKGLVVWLSPAGRGRLLTHGLLPREELDAVRVRVGAGGIAIKPPTDDRAAAGPSYDSGSRSAELQPADRATLASLTARLGDLERTVADLVERLAVLELESGPGRVQRSHG
ncbi:MAG: DUF480 domain-containing protein [Planctomycetaceae bacterium]